MPISLVVSQIKRMPWRVCGLSSWLRAGSSTVATLSAVRAVRGRPLPGTLSDLGLSFFVSKQPSP